MVSKSRVDVADREDRKPGGARGVDGGVWNGKREQRAGLTKTIATLGEDMVKVLMDCIFGLKRICV